MVSDITQNTPFFEIGKDFILDDRYFDTFLKSPKKTYATHKVLLSQCSGLNIFSITPDSSSKVTIEINFQVDLDKLLTFLYGMEPVVTENDIIELLNFSKAYKVISLQTWCIFKIQSIAMEKHFIDEICISIDPNYREILKNPLANLHPSEYLHQHLEKRLEEMKEGKAQGDFKISIPNYSQSFGCDKTLLIARSDYFRSMLTHGFKEKHNNEIIMDQVESPKQMILLLEHFYGIQFTENNELNIRELMLLLIVSNFYCLKYLYQEVLRMLISNVNEDNALEILINTNHLSNSTHIERKLQNICLTSIRKKDLAEKLIEIASSANLLQQENTQLEAKLEELRKENELLKNRLNN